MFDSLQKHMGFGRCLVSQYGDPACRPARYRGTAVPALLYLHYYISYLSQCTELGGACLITCSRLLPKLQSGGFL